MGNTKPTEGHNLKNSSLMQTSLRQMRKRIERMNTLCKGLASSDRSVRVDTRAKFEAELSDELAVYTDPTSTKVAEFHDFLSNIDYSPLVYCCQYKATD